jgi:acetolactate synthase-1/2/3 large subunit
MKITVAKAIAKIIEKMKTEYVFGFNGHGNWALLDAIVHESKVKAIAARSEDHAVHMADCYWRMRRQLPLPIVCTTVGPGNMNIASALANAFFESVPMIVLAGAGSTHWFDRGGIEEFYRYGPEEWVQSMKVISKKAVLITRPDNALEMFLRAYKIAITGRPGPVVLQIPFDIQHTEIEIEDVPDFTEWVNIAPPAPDPMAICQAARIISQAERPLFIVSGGIHNACAWEELQNIVECFHFPVTTTFMGKGAFREDSNFSLGCQGRNGTGMAIKAANNCDVLIAIGTRFTDFETAGWSIYNIPERTKLIHIDIDPSEIARVYPVEVGITSDAKLAIRSLAEELKRQGYKGVNEKWLEQTRKWKELWEEEVVGLKLSNLSPLHYARLCHDAAEVINEFDKETSVLFDTGHILSFAPAFFKSSSRYIATNNGHFCRMGWSGPGAIGAKLANPNHPVVAFIGDGSFMMTGTCVATATEYSIPIILIVLNNKSLQIEREAMIRFYGRETLCDYKIRVTGELWNPDFLKMGEAMGAKTFKLEKPDDIKPVLREALQSKEPVIVDAEINLEIDAYRPLWYPYPMNFYEKA